MLSAIIYLLIQICVIALVIYLVIYVLTSVCEIPIPAKVIQIVWVIFMLIVLLMFANLALGSVVKIPFLR